MRMLSLGHPWTWLFEIVLVVLSAMAIMALVHEPGHWFGYKLVHVDSSIQWLETLPNLGTLTDGKNLVGLHFGLLFQLIPGGLALIYLGKVDPASRIALAIIVGSRLIRAAYILFTFSVVSLFSRSSFSGSDGSLGDEWEIQRILAQDISSVLAWAIAVVLAMLPVLLFVIAKSSGLIKFESLEWCVVGVAGWVIIFGILMMMG